MSQLPSVPQVINAFGGSKKIAEYMGVSDAVVSHWKNNGKFPAATYVPLKKKLAKLKHAAPDKLWTMRKPAKRKARK